jgi:hypothetical protein
MSKEAKLMLSLIVIVVHCRYGVKDTFEPEDLIDKKNLLKVTKCVEELAQLVRPISTFFNYFEK